MIISTTPTGPLEVNCCIAACENTNKAVIIDPGGNTDKVVSLLDENGLTPIIILLTHGHWDHIGGVGDLKKKYRIDVCLHKADEELYLRSPSYAEYFGFHVDQQPPIDRYIEDGEYIEFGEERIKALCTPGHSPGSVSFLGKDEVFTGDLIFQNGVGRTDLPGGSAEELYKSINDRIFSLPGNTKIYPGHGPDTTVDMEKTQRL